MVTALAADFVPLLRLLLLRVDLLGNLTSFTNLFEDQRLILELRSNTKALC